MSEPTCRVYQYIKSLTPLFEQEARAVFEHFSRQTYTEDSQQYVRSHIDGLPLTEVARALRDIPDCDQHTQYFCQYRATLAEFRRHLKHLAAHAYAWCFRENDRTTFTGFRIGLQWQSSLSRIDDVTLCLSLLDTNDSPEHVKRKREEIEKGMGELYLHRESKFSGIAVEQPRPPSSKRNFPHCYSFPLHPELYHGPLGYYRIRFITELQHESYEYQVECEQDHLYKEIVWQVEWLPPCGPLPKGSINYQKCQSAWAEHLSQLLSEQNYTEQ